MVKFLKPGKIVVLLSGRYAGRKAVVVKLSEEGTKERPYGHALVVGLEKVPLPVSKSMSIKKIKKRSRVKPFVKYTNFNHIMPTRYVVDFDFKNLVDHASMKKADARKSARKGLRKMFEERYMERSKNSPGLQYLYQKLRF